MKYLLTTLLESDLPKDVENNIKQEVLNMNLQDSLASLKRLHSLIGSGKGSSKDGAKYHFLKSHIKSLGGDASKVIGDKTHNVRVLSDYGVMKSMKDYTKKPTPAKLIHSISNAKLGKDTLIFNMGSALECPSRKLGMCQVCIGKGKCYALKAEIQYQGDQSSALRKRTLQGKQWNKLPVEDIANQMAKIIDKKGVKYVRINEAGDFGSQEDVAKVSKLADLLKGKAVVYMYTARKDLDYSAISDNLVINGSGHMVDNNFKFVPKDKFGEIKPGANVCSGECPKCDWCKTKGKKEILIKQH